MLSVHFIWQIFDSRRHFCPFSAITIRMSFYKYLIGFVTRHSLLKTCDNMNFVKTELSVYLFSAMLLTCYWNYVTVWENIYITTLANWSPIVPGSKLTSCGYHLRRWRLNPLRSFLDRKWFDSIERVSRRCKTRN